MPLRLRLMFIVFAVAILSVVGAGVASAGAPIYPHQSSGDRGSDVRALQGLLRQQMASDLYISGIFDAATVSAVSAFQTARGLPVTGMVDAGTWARLIVRLDYGATGEAVKVVQLQLNDKRRAALPFDGVLAGATATAVRSFQHHAGLTRTGIVDASTWRYLIGHF